jgi:transposase-like protein
MYKMLDNPSEISEPEGGRRPTEGSDGRSDTEVRDRPKRRRYTASYKRRVVEHVSELRKLNSGEIGSYLRQEGLYFSMVRKWEKTLSEKSEEGNKPGRKPKSGDDLHEENIRLKKELKRTKKKLAKSELIIDIQKKISKIMEEDKEV